MFKKISVGLAVPGVVLLGVYLRFIRPWQLRWGATDEEVARAMPGDVVPFSPDGKQGMYVKAFEPNQWMLWWDNKGESTWYWGFPHRMRDRHA
jgi:hypothetical protein